MICITTLVAFILVSLGCLNWGLVGILNWNFVEAIFGAGQNVGTVIVYVLVFVSLLWLIFVAIYSGGKIDFRTPITNVRSKKNDIR